MNTENKKEEYNLSPEPQTTKKEWVKPAFKVLELNNGGSIVADSTSDQQS